jgi:hypothetical protein
MKHARKGRMRPAHPPLVSALALLALASGCGSTPPDLAPTRPEAAAAARAEARGSVAVADERPEPLVVPRRTADRTAEPAPAPQPVRRRSRSSLGLSRTLEGMTFRGGLVEALGDVEAASGLTIITTPEVRRQAAENDVEVGVRIEGRTTVRRVLDALAAQAGAAWSVEDGVVVFDTRASARGPLVTRTFDVRDLLFASTDFVAPDISEIPVGDEGLGNPRTGAEGAVTRRFEPDDLVEFVRTATGPRYWDETDGASIRFVDAGFLVVTAHRDVVGGVSRSVERARF